MSVIGSNILAGSSGQGGAAGYEIERSLRFNNPGDSSYLNRTPSSAGNRKTWTWAGWVKKANNGSDYKSFFAAFNTTSAYTALDFSDSDQLRLNGLGGGSMNLVTTSVYRDLSAWYHIVVSVDTTQATASNRVKIYVNGTQVTVFGTATYPGQNTNTEISSAVNHQIGRNPYPGYPQPFNGYLADVHFIDGQALAPTDFGEYDDNNVWQPKEFTGGYTGTVYSTTSSSNVTSPELLFDGNTSTQEVGTADGTVYTMLTGLSIPCSSTLKINANANNFQVSINGGTYSAAQSVNSTYTSLTVPASNVINSVTYKATGGGTFGVSALEVDGTVLIDFPGTNSFHLDFSDNSSNAALGTDSSGEGNDWSVNNLTANSSVVAHTISANAYGGSATAVFDADLTNKVRIASSNYGDYYWTVTFTNPITIASSVKVYSAGESGFRVRINDDAGTNTDLGTSTGLKTITLNGATALNKLHFETYSGSGNGHNLYYIQVDGVNLVPATGADVDALRDSPVNGDSANDTGAGGEITGNYATFNPLQIKANLGTMENGNLTLKASGSYYIEGKSTQEVFSYNNYCELTISGGNSNTDGGFGIGDHDAWVAGGAGSYITYRENGAIISYPGNTTVATVSGYTAGDVLGMAVDTTNIKFYKNGSLQGTYAHGKSGTFFAHVMNLASNSNAVMDINFGQRSWAYAAPSNYKALCTANLPDPTIADGSTAFDTKLYTGNGSIADDQWVGV